MARDTVDVIAGYGDKWHQKMTELADRLGIPYSTLTRKLNPNDAYQLNVTEIVPFTLATDTDLIRHLCQRCGGLFVPMPETGRRALDVKGLAMFAHETGEAMMAMSTALHDGGPGGSKITAKEAAAVRKELRDTAEQIWAIMRWLDDRIDSAQ